MRKLIGLDYRLILVSVSLSMLVGCQSCTKDNQEIGNTPSSSLMEQRYPTIESVAMPSAQEFGDIIPDFSRVGYQWGDEEIPSIRLVRSVSPPADGSDATQIIQDAIDATSSGAVKLTAGDYYIYGQINLNRSGVVLRGEGESKTKLIAAGTDSREQLIAIGGNCTRSIETSLEGTIKDDYVPCGQFWVRVENASSFSVADNVVIHRPSTSEWIHDLQMDQIPERTDGITVVQWSAGKYDLYSERVVTLISGDTLHFDNPVVMSMDVNYGGGAVYKYSYSDRISECGVEDMSFEAQWNSSDGESYVRSAIVTGAAEHCWVKNISSKYFGMGLITMGLYSKNITVEDCDCAEPKSANSGGNMYSFYIEDASLCLVQRCSSTSARHDYATGSLCTGPNAFVDCSASGALADIGPHHRWNVGTLYDNIFSDGQINVQDRSWQGTGQGWAGANNVVWNSVASSLAIQNPWVSAYNYSVGNIGTHSEGTFSGRNDGVWISEGAPTLPTSLYEEQLKLRHSVSSGVMDVQ